MNIVSVIICAVIVSAPMLFTIGALIAGRVQKVKALRPVEYYPPRGYSPIDVLIKYYGHNANPHELLNPLMLYWADRGYITIEEDCKRGLKLTKLKDLEKPESVRFTKGQSKNFEIEKALFDSLFTYGKVFYTLAATESYNKSLSDFMSGAKESAKAARSDKTKKYSLASFLSSTIALIITTLVTGIQCADPLFVAMIFPIVGVFAFKSIPSGEGLMTAIKYPFFAVWGGAPFGIVVALAPFDAAMLLCGAVFSCALIVTVLSNRIDIRTGKSTALYGRICAFKTFLVEAEKSRLEFLVEENPDYFYNILPYCYVLNITHKLKSKFDRITLDGPSWYLGELRDTLMF